MSDSGFNAALAGKLRAAGQGAPQKDRPRPDGLSDALVRALRQAGAPYDALNLETTPGAPQWQVGLADAKAALPDHRLLAVLDGPSGCRALLVLENTIVDALVEVQTTGRIDPATAPPRATTQIDAALCRDFIGLFLSGFAAEMAGERAVDWPLGLSFGTHLTSDRQLDLLLPDRPYHLISADLAMGEGAKSGRLMLLVPVLALSDDGAAAARPAADGLDWARRWPAAAAEAPVALEAVLLRQSLPLARIEALQVGDVLAFNHADLADLGLADAAGRTVLRARLGCQSGKRAVCLMPGAGLPGRPTPLAPPNPGTAADATDSAASAGSGAPPAAPPEKSAAEKLIDAAMPGSA